MRNELIVTGPGATTTLLLLRIVAPLLRMNAPLEEGGYTTHAEDHVLPHVDVLLLGRENRTLCSKQSLE